MPGMKSRLFLDGQGVTYIVAHTEHLIRVGGSEVYVCRLGHRRPEEPTGECQQELMEFGTGRPFRTCWHTLRRLRA